MAIVGFRIPLCCSACIAPPRQSHVAPVRDDRLASRCLTWRRCWLEMPPKKKSGPQHSQSEEGQRWHRPWELGDPDWETTPKSRPTYEPWKETFSWKRLEITLDQLRQSQLWLSNNLRLLAESVNTDQGARDASVYEVKDKCRGIEWRLSALEERVSTLQGQIAAQGVRDKQITDRLDALHDRLLALEGVQRGTTHEPSVTVLRQEICDQLLRMATVLGNKQYEEPVSPMQAQIRAAQEVARVLRSPARSVGTSRAASPAPSVHF